MCAQCEAQAKVPFSSTSLLPPLFPVPLVFSFCFDFCLYAHFVHPLEKSPPSLACSKHICSLQSFALLRVPQDSIAVAVCLKSSRLRPFTLFFLTLTCFPSFVFSNKVQGDLSASTKGLAGVSTELAGSLYANLEEWKSGSSTPCAPTYSDLLGFFLGPYKFSILIAHMLC